MQPIAPPRFPIGSIVYDVSHGQYVECWGSRYVVTRIKYDTSTCRYDYQICDLHAFESAVHNGLPVSNGYLTDGYTEEMLDVRPRKGAGLDHDVLENPVFLAPTATPETLPFSIGDIVTTAMIPEEMSSKRTVTKIETEASCESGYMVTTVTDDGTLLRCDAGWYSLIRSTKRD